MVMKCEVAVMQFYAFDNIWSVGFRGNDGERLGTVVAFWSRAARNEWVNTEPLRNGLLS